MALSSRQSRALTGTSEATKYLEQTGSGAIIVPEVDIGIAGFLFDIKAKETIDEKMQITENVVENGTTIADNARMLPVVIQIKGFVGEINTADESLVGQFKDYFRDRLVAVSEFLPAKTKQQAQKLVKAVDDISAFGNKINRVLGTFQNIVNLFGGNDVEANRIANQVDKLRNMQRAKIPLSVQTEEGFIYQNMMIESIVRERSEKYMIDISVSLKEVIMAQTNIRTPENRNEVQKSKKAKNGQSKLAKKEPMASFFKKSSVKFL